MSVLRPRRIPGERLKQALNGILPRDIVVVEAGEVADGFLSRKDAKGKVYTYSIDNGSYPDVFMRNLLVLPCLLDLEKMQKIAAIFLGNMILKPFKPQEVQ